MVCRKIGEVNINKWQASLGVTNFSGKRTRKIGDPADGENTVGGHERVPKSYQLERSWGYTMNAPSTDEVVQRSWDHIDIVQVDCCISTR